MKKMKQLIEEAARGADMSPIFLKDITRIQLVGDKEILIENHRGIVEYSDTEIEINGGQLALRIFGKDLELKTLNAQELLITGEITQVTLTK